MPTTAIIHAFNLSRYRIKLNPALAVGQQRINQRHGLIVTLTVNQQGTLSTQYVEIAPLSGLDQHGQAISGFSPESLAQVTTALSAQLPTLLGQSVSTLLDLADSSPFASVQFGYSLLHAKLTTRFNQGLLEQRHVPLVHDAMDKQLVSQKVKAAKDNIIKVKVAQTDIDSEIAFIHHILQLNPKLRLRLDANRGFSFEQACHFLSCLPKASIDYIEEPCCQPQDNLDLYNTVKVKYALDESLLQPDFVFEAAAGIGALVIKPSLFGSLTKLQQLIEQAQHNGVRCILSSGLESDIGIIDLKKLSKVLTPDDIPGLDTLASFEQCLLNEGELNQALVELIAEQTQPINADSKTAKEAVL
ncbi:o-succinylbenzoate synthase [Shewanella intestini]|uniref:o-succinylbenzoate synthase n=1 Tax=Shewanella intestini TaxID=2017544 RepID=A0ABS5I5T7_9GAMM|nr:MULTISPECIES: o-succinylbenzoate synthase [Shewanella]MBR9728740.1 o-succinylbenzoate synthase [Shewanella intestini]MRG36816.1 o-succinylbenzoate synthase [Shewanella sp. XMDDZSB0408]